MTMPLWKLAEMLDLPHQGENVDVERVALMKDAGPGAICLATKVEYAGRAEGLGCAALLTSPDVQTAMPCLRAEKPRIAFARLLAIFDDRPVPPPGVHPAAVVAASACVDPTASVGARAVVEDDVVIGPGTRIGAGAYIGHGTRIGRDCAISPCVVIHHRCTIGNQVRVKAGAVIGGEGFGYEWDGTEHVRVPHLGTVVIEDDVDIGANSCVDRAKTGETRVGRGTKIDNLVQVAHGVRVGPYCLIAAQVGIAGSSELGAGVVMAGQSGMVDGAVLGPGAIVAAQSAVLSSLPGGKTYMGTPARDAAQMRRILAAESRLPAILGRLRALERRAGEAGE